TALQPFRGSRPIGDNRIAGIAQRAGLARPNQAPAIQNPLLRQPHHQVVDAVSGAGVEDLDLALRSEEHTSELQSRENLVCRLLLPRPPPSTLFPYTTLFRSTALQPFRGSRPIGDNRIAGIAQRAGLARPNQAPAIQNPLLRQPHHQVVDAVSGAGVEDLDLAL